MNEFRADTDAESLILDLNAFSRPWDWQDVFDRNGLVEIEIGFGRGGFLVESSQNDPDRNYLGLETTAPLAHYTAQRLARRRIRNVRLVCSDAHFVLARFVPNASVSAVHIYFPDPWPKKRHRRRRLLTEQFLTQVQRILLPNAFVYFATDFQDYFHETRQLFASFPAFVNQDPRQWLNARPQHCITNYEVKYRREGRLIHYALYRRNSEPS